VEGGKKRYATEVVARNLQLLEREKAGQVSAAQTESPPAGDDDEIFEAADDLPF
jgi:single-stranded DNA-binding protein